MNDFIPWVEKYRPKKLDEVIGQKEIVQKLKEYAKSMNMPHMLFAGPAGTGKTTCAIALARELYGDDYKHNIMELNASDARGIDVVRGQIKDFARSSPITGVPFKIIFLDEADALTPEAQQALRRTMETYSTNVRFILSANWSGKIIEPIQSRCGVFRFKPLTKEEVKEALARIAEHESLKISDKAMDALIDVAEGDMRKAINILQSLSLSAKEIDENAVYSFVAAASPMEIGRMLDYAFAGRFNEARSMLYDLLINHGISGEDILLAIHKDIIARKSLSMQQKVKLVDRIGEFNFRMTEGANERIQLEALLAYIAATAFEESK
jgi:replication factor C small subunit